MSEPKISTAEVLADSQVSVGADGQPRYFAMVFMKDDGGLSIIRKGSRNVKKGKAPGKPTIDRKANDLMLVYDHDAETHKHVIISFILRYNGQKVID